MANYHLSLEAGSDLNRLYEYGVLTFGPNQADEYYDSLIFQFQEIANYPTRYSAVDEIRKGYRRSLHGSHSIYYQLESGGIVIVRILGQQDPANAF
jgi:toxin ParE1/3/4